MSDRRTQAPTDSGRETSDDWAPKPRLSVRICARGCDFLMPFLNDQAEFVEQPEQADFVLMMNNAAGDALEHIEAARRSGKPVAWWTIEDPNSFETFLPQAARADYVFTTDEACIGLYRERVGHARVFWLPLACAPALHRPLPLTSDARDFVVSGNWYRNEARLWSVSTLVDPLLEMGHSLSLFCYATFFWPERYRRYWRGETSYLTTAEQYRQGRVVLGLNNQRTGLDKRGKTVMTSMRTFEALACGKPLLAAASDAYARLGFVLGEHMIWIDNGAEALKWGERLLTGEGARMAEAGRRYVLAHHTYRNRLERVADCVLA